MAFQLNSNRPLSDSMGYMVNKFEHVMGEKGRAGVWVPVQRG